MFAGVGERTREGNDLYREMIESGVIKLGDKQVNIMHFTFLKIVSWSRKHYSLNFIFYSYT